MGIKLAQVGLGSFGGDLAPLFKAHPLVEEMSVCDLDEEKRDAAARRLGVTKTYASLDAVCDSNVDAVAITTQHWLHGPQAIQALKAGKHVFSAVPAGVTVEEIKTLVGTVEQTGKIFMMGETSYYFPATIYCRQRYAAGDFGRIVHAEADYYHHLEHRLLEFFKARGGEQWRELAVIPPMFYPTHNTSSVISVTGAHMTHVSCHGFVDREGDDIFVPERNRWGNAFSNEAGLFRMSDGSSCLINVFWRAGHPGANRVSIIGTRGSFESSYGRALWLTPDQTMQTEVDHLFKPGRYAGRMRASYLREWTRPRWVRREWIPEFLRPSRGVSAGRGVFVDTVPIQPVELLPDEYAGLMGVSGEEGANYFIVNEFIRAVAEQKQPPNNVWMAARYTLPGIVAHESAKREGELLPIPDFGDPPV